MQSTGFDQKDQANTSSDALGFVLTEVCRQTGPIHQTVGSPDSPPQSGSRIPFSWWHVSDWVCLSTPRLLCPPPSLFSKDQFRTLGDPATLHLSCNAFLSAAPACLPAPVGLFLFLNKWC